MTFGTLPAQFPKRLPLPRVQRSVMHKKQKQDTEATAARQGTYLRNASQVSRPPVAQSPILQLLSHPVALTSGPSADRFPSHTVIKSFSCLLLWLSSRQANQQFGSPTIRSSSHRVVQPSGRRFPTGERRQRATAAFLKPTELVCILGRALSFPIS